MQAAANDYHMCIKNLLLMLYFFVRYHIPLKAILLNRRVSIVEPEWLNQPPLDTTPISTNIFEWPEVLAAAMHSVLSDMNRNPQPVRLYAASDGALIVERQLFLDAVAQYYSNTLPRLSLNDLKQLALRKVGFNGTTISIGDGK